MAHNRSDTEFMAEAHRVAQRLPRRTWPNPPVGAVVVRDGAIVGRGAHHGPGSDHAEIVALREAGDDARGATLYVTLEPCNHQGRTPPCAPRVAGSGIARVVVGARDPNPRVAGGGLDLLRAAGIEVALGVLGRGCLELIWPYVVTDAFTRTFVTLKTATTLDGRFAPAGAPAGAPVYFTGGESLRETARLRRWHDAVLVGANTVRCDRPRLDGRRAGPDALCPAADPLPACADGDLAEAAGWRTGPHLVFTSGAADPERERALRAAGADVVRCRDDGGRLDPADLLAQAAARGCWTVLLEGGPALAASFLAAGLVDRWVQFVAPVLAGGGPRWADQDLPAAVRDFSLTRAVRSGGDACLTWDRADFSARRAALCGGKDAD
jgi:diaminohydroxyphosphoribosylaminopyrimidine deaminase / 5-amino-6-(5-phosphoribosylamino)uracil reductase